MVWPYIITMVVVQLLSCVWLFATPWTATNLASLSFTISRSFRRLMSVELMMSSKHLILCHPLLLLPSIFPSIRFCFVLFFFPNESALCISWPSIGAWASVLPMNIQVRFLLGFTGLNSSRDSQESSSAPQFESISYSECGLNGQREKLH